MKCEQCGDHIDLPRLVAVRELDYKEETMVSNRHVISICSCGVPRATGDKVVMDGKMVYCNTFCHLKHGKPVQERNGIIHLPLFEEFKEQRREARA